MCTLVLYRIIGEQIHSPDGVKHNAVIEAHTE